MNMPKRVNGSFRGDLIAELLALRPYIEQILVSGRYDRPPQRADLEDAVQLVFLKALGHLHLFRLQEGGMKAWVACIARNTKIDELRTEQRQDHLFSFNVADTEREPIVDCTPEKMARVHALGAKVTQAINEMPATLGDVLRYVDSEEIEHEQIAKELGITKAAAKMRLSRARADLRDRVGRTEEHLSVQGPVPVFDVETKPSLARRGATFLGQFAHLCPPLLIVVHALPSLTPVSVGADYAAATVQTVIRRRDAATLSPVIPIRAPLPPTRTRAPSQPGTPRVHTQSTNVALDGALGAIPEDGRTVTNGR